MFMRNQTKDAVYLQPPPPLPSMAACVHMHGVHIVFGSHVKADRCLSALLVCIVRGN